MSDDTNTGTPAEQNPWYQLALKRHKNEMPNYLWNGYMRHLMESTGKKAEADEVRVIGFDRRKTELSTLKPSELEEVQAIIGLPASMDQISFAGCIFKNNVDFQSFYFPTDVVFSDAIFEGRADFGNASFADDANFMNARFAKVIDFGEASFAERAYFRNASFAGEIGFDRGNYKNIINFSNANFENWAVFSKASFAERANFNNANFRNYADFIDASFEGLADFIYASFEGLADFGKASFAESAGFHKASFVKNANFHKASFEGLADFGKTNFADEADFSASSDTPPHKGSVSFADATFKLAPSFFERQLHEDTDWQGVKWPKPPSSKEQASNEVRRYERLSLMMSKLEKYDDMHTFFCLSMRTKEIRDGRWNVASIMSRIYGALFDYGWGVERAFLLWLGHILLGFGFILGLMCIKGHLQWIDAVQSLALSFSNAHSFIGLYSGAQAKLYEAASDIPCFSFIWGVQTVIGLPLLFFLLLTIRNRFRMR